MKSASKRRGKRRRAASKTKNRRMARREVAQVVAAPPRNNLLEPVPAEHERVPDRFAEERKWCSICRAHVQFMVSPDGSYCTVCNSRVSLFSSPEERRTLLDAAQGERYMNRATVRRGGNGRRG